MSLLARLLAYRHNDDPRAAACNTIALVVASNQPFYPLYLLWLVGGDWWIALGTWLSTPFFVAVPAVARRDVTAGKALLVLAGTLNTALSLKLFGEASGVALFLIPCALIAMAAFIRAEWGIALPLLALVVAVGSARGMFGAPLGVFSATEAAHLARLNAWSVAALVGVVAIQFGPVLFRLARRARS